MATINEKTIITKYAKEKIKSKVYAKKIIDKHKIE